MSASPHCPVDSVTCPPSAGQDVSLWLVIGLLPLQEIAVWLIEISSKRGRVQGSARLAEVLRSDS